jgi:fructokinase
MKIVAIGELLWDIFPDSERLGGAAFNFAAHARRLGHEVIFLSAVGDDDRGRTAIERAAAIGLPAGHIRRIAGAATGTVTVQVDAAGHPAFTIHRPAAYDLLRLDAAEIAALADFSPDWLYFGTLHQADPHIRELDRTLMNALPRARRFYDVNLRRNCYDAALVDGLLRCAQVVKLNDDEVAEVDRLAGLSHSGIADFCRDWTRKLGWQAVCITLGERGSALLVGGEYIEVPGYPVRVVDTVGSGDAFAAAFLHGLDLGWPPARIGDFANRLGAVVASRAGGVPEWTLRDCDALGPPSVIER